MDIQINNFPVEIELEDEKTVKDVVSSISQWANERELIFIGVDVDGNHFGIEEVPEISIEGVSVLNCLIQSRADIVYETLNEAIIYCDRVIDYMVEIKQQGVEADELDDLVSGMEWLQEVFSTVSTLLSMDLDEVKFRDKNVTHYVNLLAEMKHTIITYLAEVKENQIPELDNTLFHELKEIFAIFMVSQEMKRLITESIDSPETLIVSLKEIRDVLPEQVKNLEETAAAYQTGKDDEAAERLFQFIDFIFDYTRTCYQIAPVFSIDLKEIVVDDLSLDEKNRELQNLLHETLEVMENNDMISLADILEYEIMESINNIDKYIDILLENIID
jgi:hypothetical protein